MKTNSSDNTDARWQKTPVANLVRNVQSSNYYARIRVRGKLIWRSLSTVSKIEDGSLRIDLTQLYYLAVALRVHPIHFLPKMDWSKPVKAQIYSQ